ncbi:radical SAM protein [Mariniblastus fucicola]|uniref:Antilisterial bacteriocin subtilosin biosynthesis protein AlbA n=1 Tax=Mariniblastus fucicola TaxID=980251 RepID=A0A5B9P505_9BACT|nr:radical SAM protein [Mariniblastus fucicola]QEG20225.1 Antilisterial bacteriocin subtilosin biosynthesis protein AlbA [Mariniblastus fucicola]
MAGQLNAHLYLGTTQSLCPDCLNVVPAKIVNRDGQIWFDKFCPDHGSRSDFVCSDAKWWDRMEFNVPGRRPVKFGVEPNRGCPYDCGLCTQHEQHTCIAVLELTDSCNLKCPMCYAASGPGRKHLTFDQCVAAIDRLVEVEGRPEILQLSGGEPTIHPQFAEVLQYACDQPIDLVMVNTNGIRIASDERLVEVLAQQKNRCQIYLQMDGLNDRSNEYLRGESLLDRKMKATEVLGAAGLNVTLVATMQPDLNMDQIGPLIEFAIQRPWITGVSFQPATYVGRSALPEDLSRRITFPDIIREVELQTQSRFRESDFFPIPCAHPNAHTLCYAFRSGTEVVPVTRFVDIEKHFDLLANGISLNRENTRQIVEQLMLRESCGPGCDCSGGAEIEGGLVSLMQSSTAPKTNGSDIDWASLASDFFSRAMSADLGNADMFRITTTSFMDVYNFDIRQLMKSCVHHLLPSGHLVPFCAWNVLYRDGHIPLPDLEKAKLADTVNLS